MDELHCIRLENLRWLIENKWEAHEIAAESSINLVYLRQCLRGKHAQIGTSLARKIEKGMGLDDGWLSRRNPEVTGNIADITSLSDVNNLATVKLLLKELNQDEINEVILHAATLLNRK